MNDFPIEIAEKILLLTENPCRYNRVSKTWYRATKKNNFWYKYVSTRYQQDLGPLFNYYNAWVSSGGDLLDMSKIHYTVKYMQDYAYQHCTKNNLPNLDNLLYDFGGYGLKLSQNHNHTRLFVGAATLKIDLGNINFMLRGPTSTDAAAATPNGCFWQFSIMRSPENELFFKWFINLENQVEQNFLRISQKVIMKKKICDPANKWFNLNMHNRPCNIYSAHLEPKHDCPVVIDNMLFTPQLNTVSPIIPVGYKWYGRARVIMEISHVWHNNKSYGISIGGPKIIFLPNELPSILQTPFQDMFNSSQGVVVCKCDECKDNQKWDFYLEKNEKRIEWSQHANNILAELDDMS